MILNNLTHKTQERGFTIVELLIVIVVIGILAAITLVAYNGIQSRANTTSAQNVANTVAKKAEAYNSIESRYPTSAELTSASGPQEVRVASSTIGTPSATNGKTVVSYAPCGAAANHTGAVISYWDFTVSPAAVTTAAENASKNKSYVLGTGC